MSDPIGGVESGGVKRRWRFGSENLGPIFSLPAVAATRILVL